MKTCSIDHYQMRGTFNWQADIYYQGRFMVGVNCKDFPYGSLLDNAKTLALRYGFTHYRKTSDALHSSKPLVHTYKREPVNKLCKDLQGEQYSLQLDSQELQAILESVETRMLKRRHLSRDQITGALVSIGDGDYLEVWLTESNRPYTLGAMYGRVI